MDGSCPRCETMTMAMQRSQVSLLVVEKTPFAATQRGPDSTVSTLVDLTKWLQWENFCQASHHKHPTPLRCCLPLSYQRKLLPSGPPTGPMMESNSVGEGTMRAGLLLAILQRSLNY